MQGGGVAMTPDEIARQEATVEALKLAIYRQHKGPRPPIFVMSLWAVGGHPNNRDKCDACSAA